MRMKKLMIFAVAAIALVACSKEFDTNKSASNGTAIGFNTWGEKLTKRTQGSGTFVTGDDFAVYGYKLNTSSAKTTVFDGDAVELKSSGDWEYSHLRFWDTHDDITSYTFFALSPASLNDALAGHDSKTGEFTTTETITFAGNDNDVLAAEKKTVSRTGTHTYGASADYETVALVFHHGASLFDLKVKKHANLANATVEVTEIALENINKTGKFAISDAYDYAYKSTSNVPVFTWTEKSGAARATYTNTSGVTSVNLPKSGNTPEEVSTAGVYLIQNLIVMPQTFRTEETTNTTDQVVKISYKITNTDVTPNEEIVYEDVYFDLKEFDTTENDDENTPGTYIAGWEQGKHYVYTITIDANVITFSGSIEDWADATGYHYLLN